MVEEILSEESDKKFMREAITLANQANAEVFPNPKVGAVIVLNDEIIGKGYHEIYGGAHAEVNAINSVKDKSVLKDATIYVTLEPCSHHGKTPPCADLLVHNQFKRVVIGSFDPFPEVNGKGIKRLLDAGITVKTGVLEEECDFMNRRFLTFHKHKRPYIVLKWAETADGFIDFDRTDTSERKINWISGKESQTLVHQWRSEEQGILVGWKTISNDNPQLNVRHVKGKNPIRIILDANLSSPKNSHIFDQQQSTLIYNNIKDELEINLHFIQLKTTTFTALLNALYKQNIVSVLVEGGKQTLQQFIANETWDEIRQFISPNCFESGLKAPQINLKPNQTIAIGNDTLNYYFKH